MDRYKTLIITIGYFELIDDDGEGLFYFLSITFLRGIKTDWSGYILL